MKKPLKNINVHEYGNIAKRKNGSRLLQQFFRSFLYSYFSISFGILSIYRLTSFGKEIGGNSSKKTATKNGPNRSNSQRAFKDLFSQNRD